MSQDVNAAGLAINWHLFGSNGHEKADYSRDVLERFTRRAPDDYPNPLCKNISNPRKINYVVNGHFAVYFENFHAVNEHAEFTKVSGNNSPVTAEKIIVNHYHTKSREEYAIKRGRGIADRSSANPYPDAQFTDHDRNEVFDDGILRYRHERSKNFRPPDKSRAAERLLNALTVNLSPTLLPNTPQNFYFGKLETFLTCRAVAEYLQTRLTNNAVAKFFEEASLVAILKSINGMNFADARLFLRELPKLLKLPYPVAKDLRNAALQIIPQLMNTMHMNGIWKEYVDLDYLTDILKE